MTRLDAALLLSSCKGSSARQEIPLGRAGPERGAAGKEGPAERASQRCTTTG